MARHEEFRPANPTAKYYVWDQLLQTFSFWDTSLETPARVPSALPFKFLVLRQRAVIMGFTEDESKDRIYSNEVKESDLGRSEFSVRTKERVIARGLWKNIKKEVNEIGGSYCKIIHAASSDGEVICIQIKGNGLLSWGNLVGLRKNEERLRDEFVMVDGFDQADFQGTPYSFPTFTFAGSLTAAQNKKADELDKQLDRYYDFIAAEKSNRQSQPQPAAPQAQPARMPAPPELFVRETDDDLPF